MEVDNQNSENNAINTETFIYEGIDYNAYSLLQLAIMAESEVSGHSIAKFNDNFRLQMIVIKSQVLDVECCDLEKLTKLLDYVYKKQGFAGDWKAFFKVKNALVSSVLARRKGVPISLGFLLIEMLTQTGFEADGICFPSGFIIKVAIDNKSVYIDPFNGELVSVGQLELKARGQLGNHVRLKPEMLEADNKETIIKRYINVLKAAYIQADNIELALLCSDILLRLDPEDAFEVRDRGFLFQQLECFQLASNDFNYFIEQCPEDPIVNLLKQQIKKMSAEHSTQIIH